jgi:hypothetical protein
MAKCGFSVSYSGPIEEAKERIEDEFVERGGHVSFTDDTQGTFDIAIKGAKVAGNVEIQDGMIVIQITDKPYWLPCKAMEAIRKIYVGCPTLTSHSQAPAWECKS